MSPPADETLESCRTQTFAGADGRNVRNKVAIGTMLHQQGQGSILCVSLVGRVRSNSLYCGTDVIGQIPELSMNRISPFRAWFEGAPRRSRSSVSVARSLQSGDSLVAVYDLQERQHSWRPNPVALPLRAGLPELK